MSLNKEYQQWLLDLAKESIAHGLATQKPLSVYLNDFPEELTKHRASFVTLEINQQLRGCIGLLEAMRPLVIDICENAFSAAFKDPRFPPLSAEEFELLDIHISILTPATKLVFSSESDLIAQLRPNIDGLILKEGFKRGTFLPVVWQSLPKPEQFLAHLKQKAGLPAHYWSDTIEVLRYETEMF